MAPRVAGRRASFAGLTLVIACGGAPMQPSPSPEAPQVTLSAGTYRLRITAELGEPVSVCLSVGGSGDHLVEVSVVVEAVAGGWTVKTADGLLVMRLTPSRGATVTGTITGVAVGDGGLTASMGADASSVLSVSGEQRADGSIAGAIGGQVTFGNAAGTSSCGSNGWLLTAR